MFEEESKILPEFPRTPHLPFEPNAERNDLVASPEDAAIVLTSPNVYVEEKIDAANSGMCHCPELNDGQPLIRNRNYILRKGYGRKNTSAKLQFAPIWNWYYDHVDWFEALNELFGFPASVYGEWMYAQHTIYYNALPDYFIAYDVYDHRNGYFVDTKIAREYLELAGFSVVPLLQVGVKSYEELKRWMTKSPWAAPAVEQAKPEDEKREGLYIKVTDGVKITHRFKMRRADYKPGQNFSNQQIRRNRLAKKDD